MEYPRTSFLRVAFAPVLVAVIACGGAGSPPPGESHAWFHPASPVAPGAEPRPVETQPSRFAPPPPGKPALSDPVAAPPTNTEPRCDVRFATRVRRDGSRYWLSAHAFNTTDHEIVLTMTDRCPLGPIEFTGLTPEYDYYGGCTKGACITHGEPMSIRIPARKEVELALVDIDPAGAGCNRPLERRRYDVSFVQPRLEHSCGPSAETIDLSHLAPPAR